MKITKLKAEINGSIVNVKCLLNGDKCTMQVSLCNLPEFWEYELDSVVLAYLEKGFKND